MKKVETSLLIPLAGLLCLALVILGSLLAGTEAEALTQRLERKL